ncbi:MAG: TolC family protein [Lentisphaeraceae bacterium]|nr:TolC family protein [Lentisphaeraceae bacterium]
MNRIIIIFGSLLLSSCRIVQVQPEQAVYEALNRNLVYTAPDSGSQALPKQMSLYQARQLALKNNPDIEAAQQRIQRAKAVYEQAEAAYYPTVTAGAGVTHHHHTPVSSGFRNEAVQNYNTAVNASWLIYDGMARQAASLAASYGQMSASQRFKDVSRLLKDAVAAAYYQTLLAHEQMRINGELKKINEKFLEDTQAKFEAGASSRSDVNNFLVNVNDAHIAWLDARKRFNTARIALAELLGLPEADTSAFIPEKKEALPELPELQILLKTALAKRPDLRAIQADILAAEARIKEAEAEYSPRVSLDAAAGYNSDRELRFSQEELESRIGVNVNWNLFSGGSTAAKKSQFEAEKNEQMAILKAKWHEIQSRIRQEYESFTNSIDKFEVQKKSAEINRSIYQDTQEIYNNGATTITRVNEVLSNYTVSLLNQALFKIESQRRYEILKALMGTQD